MLSIRQWRSRHLLRAWLAYWVTLTGVALGPAIAAIARVSGPSGKGSASAGFGDGGFNLVVTNANGPTWSGSASLTSIAFWLAGPPLVMWAIWLLTRPARPPLPIADATTGQHALGMGAAEPYDIPARDRDAVERD